jgi:hypothetical protein
MNLTKELFIEDTINFICSENVPPQDSGDPDDSDSSLGILKDDTDYGKILNRKQYKNSRELFFLLKTNLK